MAADCVNRPRDFAFSKRTIAQGLHVDRDALLGVAASLTVQTGHHCRTGSIAAPRRTCSLTA
ncbi:oxidoreductase C-terminal domain-containing protein [Nocardioides convexus]|uniref:oxidoreductase C-terminal domain-containing protein n=1 Tax=Nocardioides convexus TaxID=2712224 RepID=UPI002418BA65|nr:oxidoreductase C-terminal domain-containing protein [Nocardioides convexus]